MKGRGEKRLDAQHAAEEICPKCARMQAECEALRQRLERNKAELDAFVYRVSHDLKAPVVRFTAWP